MPRNTAQLLLVDDDRDLAQLLSEILELEGYTIRVAEDGETALQQMAEQLPDLVLLDVMLPGIDGFETLRRIRATHELPVIMLTARGGDTERVQGLTGGADDYVPKPFNPAELLARIANVLRRVAPRDEVPDELQAGPLRLDRKRRQAYVDTTPVTLTAAEQRVLEQLLQRTGEVLSRANLTQLALDRPLEAYDRSIDTLVSRLRKKLAEAGLRGNAIRSLRGHGYVLDLEGNPN